MLNEPLGGHEPASFVYVVDDDASVRDSLRWLVESVGCTVGTFATASTFLEAHRSDEAGCLIVDVRMPNIGGFELSRILRDRKSTLSTIFITAHGDVPMSVRAMKAGAVDFFEKPFNYQVLLDAIQVGLAKSREAIAVTRARCELDKRLDLLSVRERDVLGLVVAGLMTKQIAHELGISIKTVEIHRSAIRRKLQEVSLAQIVAMTVQHHHLGVGLGPG